MMPLENKQEFRSVGVWNVSFCCQFACRLTSGQRNQGTTGRTRGLQTERSFSLMQDFRQSTEAVDFSQVSKMLRPQLTGQFQLTTLLRR